MVKSDVKVVKRNGINYLYHNGKRKKYKPWLGDLFSFLYDSIMSKSVFPKKFEASIEKHDQFLKNEFKDMHNQSILELATGSGNMAEILPADNKYTGIDISPGLLKIAYQKFCDRNFKNPELFVCSAQELPFVDRSFDAALCHLSLNFFDDLEGVLGELKRVLKNRGLFICTVPVPERNKKHSVIRGKLFSENELKEIFTGNGFEFIPYNFENGALLYFKGIAP
jgi:SAM-dependent methyltransferase